MQKHKPYILVIIIVLLCIFGLQANAKTEPDTVADRILADMRQYFNTDNREALYKATGEYRTHALEMGNTRNYYKGWETEILYDVNFNRFYQAMKKTQQMSDMMRKRDDRDFFYSATHLIGIIHSIQGNNKQAKTFFEKALREASEVDSVHLISIYMDLANVEMEFNQKEALMHIDKALNLIDREKMPYQYSDAMAFKTIIAFVKHDWPLVNKCFKLYTDIAKKDSALFSTTYLRYATVAKRTAEGKYAEAIAEANKMMNIDKYKFKLLIYEAAGDTANAYMAQKEYITAKDSITQFIQSEELQSAAHDLEVASSISEARKTKAINIIFTICIIGALIIICILLYNAKKRKHYAKTLEEKNKELEVARFEAEKAENMKMTIMKNMSHEIRSPLNVISGFAQVIGNKEFEMTESVREDLAKMVQKSTDSITKILNELLDISDNRTRYSKVTHYPERINDICEEAARRCRKLIENDVIVSVVSELPDDFTISTNKAELLKAMDCVLDNAVKFTDEGTITIGCRLIEKENDKKVEISISDTGCGIEEGEEELIFDHFYKTDKYKDGIGLGLPLARRITYHLNGRLTVDTKYKKGARFVFALPTENKE